MLLLYQMVDGNFLLALAIFTVFTRLILLPINLRQQRSTLRMQEMQPKVQAIQKKYRDNPQKMQEEFGKIGYNPTEPLLGCLPLLLQMPIFFALFQVINLMLEGTPQSVLSLFQRANPNIDVVSILPLQNTFMWLNLAQPDPYFILPVLVGATMFLQQKLLTPAKKKEDETAKGKKGKKDDQPDPTAQMTQSMQYTMPLMFGFFSLSFPSGLSIYFVISNIIGIFQGYIVRRSMAQARAEADERRAQAEVEAQAILRGEDKVEMLGDGAESDDDLDEDDVDDVTASANGTSGQGSSKKRRKNRSKRR
ncbi:MAG: membrane protein insertase YidC [Anaerolineales bacterium]|nr:membrane protein insertase YidC [Anaerolineales bacterium]